MGINTEDFIMVKPDNEAQKIYHAIFNKNIPESVQLHFNNISRKIDDVYLINEVNKYHECIVKVHDLEALEIAARYVKKLPIITDKFKAMIYLAETLPENYSTFVNERPQRFLAFFLLMHSVLRSLLKLAKGMFLLVINRV